MPDSAPTNPPPRWKAGPRPARTTTRTPRAASPTRSIDPGVAHGRIATGILRNLQERAAEAGLELDVGELPDIESLAQGRDDDPERLAKIVARMVARVGDRFAFLRKLSRHLEGTDKRAGILSDLISALWILYQRNPRTTEAIALRYVATVREHGQARKAKLSPNHHQQNGGNNSA